MSKHHLDYFWKNGIPFGIQKTEKPSGLSYKIVSDPYRKWISIEQYQCEQFDKVIYDSYLFDFRSLKTLNQVAWLKETLHDHDEKMRCLIRNQDDRAVLSEEYSFHDGRCRECCTSSIHGLLVSKQKIYYQFLGDSFNGVLLFDANAHIVMQKKYTLDEKNGEFAELLNEEWNGQNCHLPE